MIGYARSSCAKLIKQLFHVCEAVLHVQKAAFCQSDFHTCLDVRCWDDDFCGNAHRRCFSARRKDLRHSYEGLSDHLWNDPKKYVPMTGFRR